VPINETAELILLQVLSERNQSSVVFHLYMINQTMCMV